MQVEPDTILFGEKGVDDWAFAPSVIARLDDGPGYLILEEDDEDADPAEQADWPVVAGNQIVWIDDGDEAEPLALVSADRVGDQETLEEVANEWARGSDGVEIDITDSGEVRVLYETGYDV